MRIKRDKIFLMKLKILQWNVLYKEDPNKIANEIKKIGADIVCGQELIQHLSKKPQIDTAKEIANKISYQYIYGRSQLNSGFVHYYGNT